MNKAAGILFLSKSGKALFLRRRGSTDSVTADFPGYWDFPGGGREDDETAEECARREATEEVGDIPKGDLVFHTRTAGSAPKGVAGVGGPPVLPVQEGPPADPAPGNVPALPLVDYATFLQRVDEEFTPELNDEHDGWAWSPVEAPPTPLHPGCQVALDRLSMNELGVARAIADGRLASPQRYENMWLFAIRITGVDLAYRPKGGEFVVRDAEHWQSEDALARCNGLPVIWKHPKGALLDGKEFLARIVGTVFLPYIAGAETWAVAKIYVDEAARAMAEGGLSTSPGVNFADWSVNKDMTLRLADGSREKVLHEGDPSLFDHVAVCELGVWDKGDGPSGIRSEAREDSAMADKDDDKAKDDAARKDAEEKEREEKERADKTRKDAEEKEREDKARRDADAGKEPDNHLSHVMDAVGKIADAMTAMKDDFGKRFDAFGKRMDAYDDGSGRKDGAKKDEDEDGGKKGEAEPPVADKAKKDAEEKEQKEKEDARKDRARKDAADAAVLADIDKRLKEVRSMIPKDVSDADYQSLMDAQARADDVFVEFGLRAPRSQQGQSVMAYDRYVTTKLQEHSPTWKGKDLRAITDDAFPIIRDQVFAEAKREAANPVNVPDGKLRPVERRENGHIITTFHGQPRDWMNQFAGPVQMRGTGNWLHPNMGGQQGNR